MSGNKSELFRRLFCKEVAVMNGFEFESFCFPFFKFLAERDFSDICGRNFNHAGHNSEGKSVGYSVDFIDDRYIIAGQCTTELDAFTSKASEKFIKDIDGSIKNNPNLKVVYIFSNQESGSRVTNRFCVELITHAQTNYSVTLDVKIFDARLLSDIAFDNKHIQSLRRAMLEKCTFYEQYDFDSERMDNIPYNVFCFLDRELFYEQIKAHFDKESIVQIYGPSGIGKTEIAKGFARKYSENYDYILWFDMSYVKGINGFSLSRIAARGGEFDLERYLKNFKCLVVLDNLNYSCDFLGHFTEINHKESKLILTSVSRFIDEANVSMREFSVAEIKDLLNRFDMLSVSGDIALKVYELTSGYPLSVYLLAKLVQEGDCSWNDILQLSTRDVLELDVAISTDDESHRLKEVIMNKVFSGIREELRYVFFIKSNIYFSGFLEKIMGFIPVKKLLKRGILTVSEEHYYRVHDFVVESMHQMQFFREKDTPNWSELVAFAFDLSETKSMGFYRFMQIHCDFLLTLIQSDSVDLSSRRKLMCAIGQFKGHKYISELNESGMCAEVFVKDDLCYHSILVQLELMEYELSRASKKKDEHAYFERCDMYYSWLMSLVISLTDGGEIENVRLHAGKILARKRDYDGAMRCFDVCGESPFVLLQKARNLERQKKVNDLSTCVVCFFERCVSEGFYNVPSTVLMGFVELMCKDVLIYERCMNLGFDKIYLLRLVRECIDFGLEQHLKTTLFWSQNLLKDDGDRGLYWEIFGSFCEGNDFSKFNQNCLAYVSFVCFSILLSCNDADVVDSVKNRWISSVRLIHSEVKEWDYFLKIALDLCLDSGSVFLSDFLIYERFFPSSSRFVKQKVSKLYCRAGFYVDALNYIEDAISSLGASEVSTYGHAFNLDRDRALLGLMSC